MNLNVFGKNKNADKRRLARFAGTWYKNDPKALGAEIDTYLERARNDSDCNLIDTNHNRLEAIISPHAGFMYSGQTAAYSYCRVEAKKKEIKRVLLLGPSHYLNISGVALSSFDAYQTPLGDIGLDKKTTDLLLGCKNFQTNDALHEREHSLELQTAFIRHILGEIEMIPMVVGSFKDQNHIRQCASKIANIQKPGDLFVISSDFTHFGPRYDYVPFYDDISANIKKLDLMAYSLIERLELKEFLEFQSKTDCTICGFNPICLLLATLSKNSTSELLHYETSRNQGSDDDMNSVSYLAISFQNRAEDNSQMSITDADKHTLLRLARFTAEYFCNTNKKPTLDQLPPDIVLSDFVKQPMGVFVTFFLKNVSLHEENLRGCIGYILPMMPLYQAVIDNAIGACSKDYRFLPVHEEELKNIKIEISVLTKPEPVADYKDIVIGKHGILLHAKGRQSVFLPHVATEYGWTLEETLNQLALKAGLKQDAWRKNARFEVFESVMFEEEI
ncbi:MAG: AmmeMemoRadiSam system protein B [Candidatus Melainabacteria bacterium]|nr:AmmeMemoRadiSam system protein B [Candidatus Melainabacteria bacterium]